jgi:hypothetical protein
MAVSAAKRMLKTAHGASLRNSMQPDLCKGTIDFSEDNSHSYTP